jgi:hypothetical protein
MGSADQSRCNIFYFYIVLSYVTCNAPFHLHLLSGSDDGANNSSTWWKMREVCRQQVPIDGSTFRTPRLFVDKWMSYQWQ